MALQRVISYQAPRGHSLDLEDLAQLIIEVNELSGYNSSPVVTIMPTTAGGRIGPIKKISIEGTPRFCSS